MWPQAVSISQYRLRQIADRLAEKDLLEKRKFNGGQTAYQITSKGRELLSERNRRIHSRAVDEAEKLLRKSLGMKPPINPSTRKPSRAR